MTQRKKQIVVIGSTLSLLFGFLYIAVRLILSNSFVYLEETDTHRNVQRALSAIQAEVEAVSITTADWAYWDDTYAFVTNQNEDYILSNLSDNTLYTLQLNTMLYLDTNGEVVFEKTLDLETGTPLTLGEELAAYLTREGLVQNSLEHLNTMSGILQLSEHTLIVAAYPILPSERQGPTQGILVFGRILTEQWVENISAATHLDLALETWDAAHLSSPLQTVQNDLLSQDEDIIVHPLDDRIVVGYALINSVDSTPAMLVRVAIPREIYRQGQTTLNYFGGALFVIGLVFSGVLLTLLEKNRLKNEQFEIIFRNSDDAICLIDAQGTLLQVNPAFEDLFLSTKPFKGHLKAVVKTDPDHSIDDTLNELQLNKSNVHLDLVTYKRSGEKFHADMTVSPVLGSDSRVSSMVCSFRDITAQKRLEEQLRKALNHEMEISKAKAQFVSMASHELRTPLAEIKLSQEMLERYSDRLDQEKKQQKLNTIGSSVKHMQQILDDVLTLSRAEANQFVYAPEWINLEQFINNLTHQHAHICARNITLSTSGDLSRIWLDPKLLRHILDNLLTNAMKYSPPHTNIDFDVTLQGDDIVFTIRDEGHGIPLEEQPHVFDMFFRSKHVVNIPGTGLGLPIVKHVVSVHGGTIQLQSNEGQGTKVTVRLPHHPPGRYKILSENR